MMRSPNSLSASYTFPFAYATPADLVLALKFLGLAYPGFACNSGNIIIDSIRNYISFVLQVI